MAEHQNRFGQQSLALDGDQVRIRELTGLPLASGLRETLLALNAAGGDLATTRADLAQRLGVHPSTVSRRAARLVASGLLKRVVVGAEVAWRIDWLRVLDYEPAVPEVKKQTAKGRSTQAEVWDGCEGAAVQAVPVAVAVPATRGVELGRAVERGVWARRVVLACLVIPVTLARLVLRVDAAVRAALPVGGCGGVPLPVPSGCNAVTAAELVGRTGDGVMASAERGRADGVRAERVRLAPRLPFTREIVVGAVGAEVGSGAGGVRRESTKVPHSPQLAERDLEKNSASSSGGSSEGRKKYISIDWDLCRDRTGKGPSEQIRKLVAQGHISPEETESFHQFLNGVRRRAYPSGLLPGEKLLSKPAGYIAHVVGNGTWRDDIRREDREWWAGIQDQARRQQVVGAGS